MPDERSSPNRCGDAAFLVRMRGQLREEQRRVRQTGGRLILNAALALLCSWAAVLSEASFLVRCLLAGTVLFQISIIVTLARRHRMARMCRRSCQWHVAYAENRAKAEGRL